MTSPMQSGRRRWGTGPVHRVVGEAGASRGAWLGRVGRALTPAHLPHWPQDDLFGDSWLLRHFGAMPAKAIMPLSANTGATAIAQESMAANATIRECAAALGCPSRPHATLPVRPPRRLHVSTAHRRTDRYVGIEQLYFTSLYWAFTMLMKSPHIGPDTWLEKLFSCFMVPRHSPLAAHPSLTSRACSPSLAWPSRPPATPHQPPRPSLDGLLLTGRSSSVSW